MLRYRLRISWRCITPPFIPKLTMLKPARIIARGAFPQGRCMREPIAPSIACLLYAKYAPVKVLLRNTVFGATVRYQRGVLRCLLLYLRKQEFKSAERGLSVLSRAGCARPSCETTSGEYATACQAPLQYAAFDLMLSRSSSVYPAYLSGNRNSPTKRRDIIDPGGFFGRL